MSTISMKLVASLAAILAVAGCSGVPDPSTPPAGSAAFRAGYRAGCESGHAEAYPDMKMNDYHKAESKYAGDDQYRSGWDLGYSRCYKDYIDHEPMITGS